MLSKIIQKRFLFHATFLSLLSIITIGCNHPASKDSALENNRSTPTADRPAIVQPAIVQPSTPSNSDTNNPPEQTPLAQTNQSEETQAEKPQATGIMNGRYLVGQTGQGLEVDGDRYRYTDEEGQQAWQSIATLKAIQEGVLYDGENYWCLGTMKSREQFGSCSKKGWVIYQRSTPESKSLKTSENLPFVGKRFFNFLGGSGTGYSITIESNGNTVIQRHGTVNSSILYQGLFQETMVTQDEESITIKDGYADSCDERKSGSEGESAPCRGKLYE